MTLKDCTKEELLIVIEHMKHLCFSSGDYYVAQALGEVVRRREEKKMEEANRLNQEAHQWRMEYIEAMKPYKGKKLGDIPLPVLNRARECLHKADEADRRWNKLMGIRMEAGK